jgi:hypothetical protein
MTIIKKILLLIFWSPVFLACNREKDRPAAFSATGFWEENSAFGSIGILNRPDGTSRLYLMDQSDTSAAMRKYDGVYSVHGDTYRFQTLANREGIDICLETSRNASGKMTGVLSTQSYRQLAAIAPF